LKKNAASILTNRAQVEELMFAAGSRLTKRAL